MSSTEKTKGPGRPKVSRPSVSLSPTVRAKKLMLSGVREILRSHETLGDLVRELLPSSTPAGEMHDIGQALVLVGARLILHSHDKAERGEE